MTSITYENHTEAALREKYLAARKHADTALRAANIAMIEYMSGANLDMEPLTRDSIELLCKANIAAEIPILVDKHYGVLRNLAKYRLERRRFIIRAGGFALACAAVGFAAGAWL